MYGLGHAALKGLTAGQAAGDRCLSTQLSRSVYGCQCMIHFNQGTFYHAADLRNFCR